MNQLDDALTTTFIAATGRDAGKQFTVLEVDPMTKAGYVLRFNAALRIDSYQALIDQWRDSAEQGEPNIDMIMRTMQGSDPVAIHTLISELLDYVRISPDPQHPGVNRTLMKDDIREMKTLGEVLLALVKLNFISEV